MIKFVPNDTDNS